MEPPTTDPGVIFFLVIVGLITAAGIAYAVLLVARWNANRIRYVAPPRVRSETIRSPVRHRPAPYEIENEPANAANLASERRTEEGTGTFALNLDECAAVARMIEHKATAEKPTKASCIWAGFGVKKGSSAKYQRASEIYDTLFVIPPEEEAPHYRPLTPDKQPV